MYNLRKNTKKCLHLYIKIIKLNFLFLNHKIKYRLKEIVKSNEIWIDKQTILKQK